MILLVSLLLLASFPAYALQQLMPTILLLPCCCYIYCMLVSFLVSLMLLARLLLLFSLLFLMYFLANALAAAGSL
jgi:hypothetical protein